jgi:hypothetical protein
MNVPVTVAPGPGPDRTKVTPPGRPRRRPIGAWRALFGLAVVLSVPAPVSAQTPPPDAGWLTFETPNFQVVFHAGLDSVAFRAAERAERALERLEGFGSRPPGRIQLVVTDHVDLSNGFASVTPYPRITIWARPPVDGPGAMPFDDWLELVVTHEVVHVLHLEMTGPLGRFARRVMGRVPAAWPHFPAFILPSWAVEGVAVEAESSLTEGGRIHGARFEAILRARLLEGKGERLDQVMGPSPLFPGGERPYTWGGLFFHHLAETHGSEAVGDFFRIQAGRLNPLRFNASSRDAFGRTLDDLHEDWLEGAEADARADLARVLERRLAPEPVPLTRGARFALHPAFRPGDGAMAWMRADGVSEPALVVDGEPLAPVHQLAPFAWGPGDTIWTTQPEFVDRYRIRGDIWAVAPDGTRRRVTEGLRATGLDVHAPTGRIVAVVEVPATNTLVLLGPDAQPVRTLVEADPGVHWSHPRWSPDGTRVAVTRWEAGGRWEIGILHLEATPGTPLFVAVDGGRTPSDGAAWAPDGRSLVWSSERSGVPNLYTVSLDATGTPTGGVRQLSDLVTAGVFPSVTPDGRGVIFSHLAADGWELAALPYGDGAGFDPLPVDRRHLGEAGGPAPAMAEGHRAMLEGEVRTWSPLGTLRPRYWLPSYGPRIRQATEEVLAPALGFRTGATDVLARNSWDARFVAPLSGPGRRWEGDAAWSWAGLGNPVLTATMSQAWDALGRVAAPEGGDPLHVALRERSIAIDATALRPGFRASRQFGVTLRGLRNDFFLLEAGGGLTNRAALVRPTRDLVEVSAVAARSSVRSYPFQPGPQEGSQFAVRLRARHEPALADSLRGVAGRDASTRDIVVSARHFRPLVAVGRSGAGGAPPVFAVRGAVGLATGPGVGPATLRAGGGGGAGTGPLGATWARVPGAFQVRGYDLGARGGDRAWGAGAELRIPLSIVNRGVGVLPVYLDRLASGIWVDAADASLSRAPAGGGADLPVPEGALVSAGGEIALAHGFGTWTPGLLRIGVAVPIRGEIPAAGGGLMRPGASIYAGIGWSF